MKVRRHGSRGEAMSLRLGGAWLAVALLPGALAAQGPSIYRLTMGDAARLAAERSAPVLEAHARSEAAEARVRESLSDLLPTVDADLAKGAHTFNTASFGLDFPTLPGQPPLFDPDGEVIGPVNATDLRVSASVPVVDLGAWGRRRSARARVTAARLEEEATADVAATEAALAYLAALRARAAIDAREEDLRLAQTLLGGARALLEAGVGVAIDVTRAESQLATMRAELLSSRHSAEIAELGLRRTLRLPGDARLELVDDLGSLAGEDPPGEQDAVRRALARRRDLSAAEAHQAAARQAATAIRADRLPTLSASIDEGFYGRGVGTLLNTYAWTVSVSVPLFDGFDRSGRLGAQEAQVREIGHRIEDLEDDIVFQVRRALLDLAAAGELAAAAGERLRLAELEVSQEEERLRAGVTGTGDVVRAALRLNEARTAQLDALTAVQASRIAVAEATGTVSDLR